MYNQLDLTHHFGAHGVAWPEWYDVVDRVLCLDVLCHAARVLAQSLGVDHSVESVLTEDANCHSDILGVALNFNLLDNVFWKEKGENAYSFRG